VEAKKRTQFVLVKVLSRSLQLLSPIAPFITEELYSRLQGFGFDLKTPDGEVAESIAMSAYPEFNEEEIYQKAFDEIEFIKEIVVGIRNLRAVVGVHPSDKVKIILLPDNDGILEKVRVNADYITNLAGVSRLEFVKDEKPDKAVTQVIEGIQIFLPVEGLVDVEKEVERIKREISKVSKDVELSQKKLSNPDFVERAPEEVVEKEKERFEELSSKKRKMEEVLEKLSGI
jgi:valyl-tRNA synthetase